MKHQAITVTFLTIVSTSAFAAAKHCANPSELSVAENVKIKFCDIEATEGFLVGSNRGDSDEKPVKARNFKKFQMAQFEVTQLQYKTVIGSEPWKEDGKAKLFVQEGDDFPASFVSFYDAQEFVRILNLVDKTATYRLPTEAEFEYAARAKSSANYFWGNEMETGFAYFWGNTEKSGKHARQVESCPSELMNEDSPGYCANKFGLFHMLGNVAEWTADGYTPNYNLASADGHQPVKGSTGSHRVIRGGAWDFFAPALRSANRESRRPSYRSSYLGFRVVRFAK